MRSVPGSNTAEPKTARRTRLLCLLIALVGLVAAAPLGSAQDESRPADEDRACITGETRDDGAVTSGILLIADAAAPQFSTGAVRVMWDVLPEDQRTGPDVKYEVYRIRADDLPDSGELVNPVPITDATFLGSTTDTEFRDTTGEQDVTYAWAVVARGDVEDEDPEACPGQDIRVFDPREFQNEFDETLPEVCTLNAEALPNGVIRLTWTEAGGDYAIYRSGGNDEEGTMLRDARVSGGELYTDELVPGVTYRFGVTVWDDDAEADVARCDTVEVTAIPFFGNPAIIALGSIGALGAVVLLRRRARG